MPTSRISVIFGAMRPRNRPGEGEIQEAGRTTADPGAPPAPAPHGAAHDPKWGITWATHAACLMLTFSPEQRELWNAAWAAIPDDIKAPLVFEVAVCPPREPWE